ncbi:hypothetical protein VTL71DRAFT_185 [Oculimacula yallundae]|uniref:RING-type domain-containing protein n=1 Tax=Oculimacula yallundae TaxID=86028 RepID=A0ABR4D087_9HELO
MSFHSFRRFVTTPESANESTAQRRPEVANSQTNINRQNSNSPFGLFGSEQAEDEPSPWSSSSTSTDFDSLTLPPINPDNNDSELPSLSNPRFFDALSRIQAPIFSVPGPSTAAVNTNTNSRPQSRTSQTNQEPPPSNQQQRRTPPPVSQYRLAGFESPDPFDDLNFDDFFPAPEQIPSASSSRRSSFVDLTRSSPDMAPATSRKRKATTPAAGRASKVTKNSTSKVSRPTSAAGKKEMADVQTIDLVDIDDKEEYDERMRKEQAEMIKKQNQAEATKSVKLAEFQCIICMDNPTDLTVTFCGHLFCSECLHQALHAGEKKCCPVCRSNIASKKPGGKPPKNGTFALEMKFMTTKKKGKQPVRSLWQGI